MKPLPGVGVQLQPKRQALPEKTATFQGTTGISLDFVGLSSSHGPGDTALHGKDEAVKDGEVEQPAALKQSKRRESTRPSTGAAGVKQLESRPGVLEDRTPVRMSVAPVDAHFRLQEQGPLVTEAATDLADPTATELDAKPSDTTITVTTTRAGVRLQVGDLYEALDSAGAWWLCCLKWINEDGTCCVQLLGGSAGGAEWPAVHPLNLRSAHPRLQAGEPCQALDADGTWWDANVLEAKEDFTYDVELVDGGVVWSSVDLKNIRSMADVPTAGESLLDLFGVSFLSSGTQGGAADEDPAIAASPFGFHLFGSTASEPEARRGDGEGGGPATTSTSAQGEVQGATQDGGGGLFDFFFGSHHPHADIGAAGLAHTTALPPPVQVTDLTAPCAAPAETAQQGAAGLVDQPQAQPHITASVPQAERRQESKEAKGFGFTDRLQVHAQQLMGSMPELQRERPSDKRAERLHASIDQLCGKLERFVEMQHTKKKSSAKEADPLVKSVPTPQQQAYAPPLLMAGGQATARASVKGLPLDNLLAPRRLPYLDEDFFVTSKPTVSHCPGKGACMGRCGKELPPFIAGSTTALECAYWGLCPACQQLQFPTLQLESLAVQRILQEQLRFGAFRIQLTGLFSELSLFAPVPLVHPDQSQQWSSPYQLYVAHHFVERRWKEAVASAPFGHDAAGLRQLLAHPAMRRGLRSDWGDSIQAKAVEHVLMLAMEQHPVLVQTLCSTGAATLIMSDPDSGGGGGVFDEVLCGVMLSNGQLQGRNLAGEALMRIRASCSQRQT